jgi:two-component system, NarL family, sensor histidine kinase LiaS
MDKISDRSSLPGKIFRQLKWRLTLTYTLVSLTAVIIMGWWVFVAATLYLYRIHTDLNWLEVVQELIMPSMALILPGVFILLIPAVLLSSYFGFLSARWLDKRLSGLRYATQAWRRGDFSVSIHDDSNDEIGAFGQELNQVAEELEQLMETKQSLASIEERYRLARDLHDSVKQSLTAAGFQLSAAREQTGQKEEVGKECLTRAEDLIYEAQQELSAIVSELRPPGLRYQEFSGAMREYIDRWSDRENIEAPFTVRGERKISTAVEECLFRLLQEALSNIARHSNAGKAEVILEYLPKEVSLTIIDNGGGFNSKGVNGQGQGLRNMRERILSLNGILVLSSKAGEGTSVKANIPV